ncbi:pyruvate:ferredoxin (flavodoxin) oxidoreductase [bacterium (Candidatus Blackallbacteria) CG17_big_fil_post_rev_8_21_14_2_50_48_46]|uniref:Pyruvate:ferredoxin (Flavodoxin) oxidoreductase n=1 Tax=bacterium (Candidatus Blackallbacteria) CG17_big_fil_post_rev_8_21_14_2_50_48_46 TaxID=2014261 RepID=A0A2M7G4X3_9BACT|nr:MAG: pyruvate:ferredoxin (flavodoxin) oxidoreductase [bacterium (Candidatus Blackallbacteria) CG18_big_fil_WC_8_21_14_2_50_49_26]PIW16970.1 MAG: pyruvate:ferredoxin (flavodoxin) oxidoreductase [bacterium (Candidatus Blackallbacteria) CG17_big_fil_post_rev_8_21_14_2_50_48_46]PIW50249.1 MAG: pyruvate:ferredoxin (flavodoxin) oxidoreductase [bacterium (Candidatus Blackallbacteria) CG13_big_fil_rev_8_21_14_2_50_49_14]
MQLNWKTMDGNEAVAHVAYRLNEVIAIYPITPSSPMGEWSDTWASVEEPNLWGTIPRVVEMQSEGGAAGALHGALQAGALSTSFTASQGLLLMMPNMYKIAGELTPLVLHVAARSLAAQGLSIFGDHSDVMACRATGFAMLAANSVQEAHDFALLSQVTSLSCRIPFLHFFDGFRTSHEISKFQLIPDEVMKALIDPAWIRAFRERALSPDHPFIRGTAQNPDIYFQARETVNPLYRDCSEVLQERMDAFAALTGRQYRIYEYHGDPQAERVIVIMGSGAETVQSVVDALNAQGEKLGVLKVRLYRPFAAHALVAALPESVKQVAVLDRTKEPGSVGEPLYLDVVSALQQGFSEGWRETMPRLIGGRYGLSSKEFTPGMVKGIFDHLKSEKLKHSFTIGIEDDLSHTHLAYDPDWSTESDSVFRGIFYGLGSDGTVGANKNSIKIIGEQTEYYAQGYFVYDSKKAGAITISHLRFGPERFESPYLIQKAGFVACHQPVFLERFDVLENLLPGGVFLLNSPHAADQVWDALPRPVQEGLIARQARFFVINANQVAQESGMKGRINTVMQTCFFAISGVLPRENALEAIRDSIQETYAKKGVEVVKRNLDAVDNTLAHLHEVPLPAQASSLRERRAVVSDQAPDFVKEVLGAMISGQGDRLPVSALPNDGTYPSGTAQWEKRNLAAEIPVWDPEVCIQCGKCAMVCPHSVIRIKAYPPAALAGAPAGFRSVPSKEREWDGLNYTIQVAPEDCTGCAVCVDVCPARNKSQAKLKAINMQPQEPLREQEKTYWEYFLELPELDRTRIKNTSIRQQQIQEPLFEFSGACSGCGETPYLKLLTQLFGDRMLVANATGCSSIYGGNLPTTPWSVNAEGRGPAWSNSLFEDNAEFGLGMRLALDKQNEMAKELLMQLEPLLEWDLVEKLVEAPQLDEADIYEQRERVKALRAALQNVNTPEADRLRELADALVRKSLWIVGGDGWAYDIGFGGLDHVLASGANVNVLVLDTEVYSNTGGQMSKSTPRGAVAKFAAAGKPLGKKDLGMIAMSYGHVYVAKVAMGAKDDQTLRAFLEAEAWPGPSLIIAYSHCIAHGIPMNTALQEHKAAVDSGAWNLFRYHPGRLETGEAPLHLDSKGPRMPLQNYYDRQNRFRMLASTHPYQAKRLMQMAQKEVEDRWRLYQQMAEFSQPQNKGNV